MTNNGIHTLYKYVGIETNLILPDSYNGNSFAIGDSVFYDYSELTSIKIPNNVTSIGNYAFYGCKGLTSVTIPKSVISIGDHAFDGCTRLKKIDFNCKNIGSWFQNNTSIEEVIIGNGVTSIEDWAFNGCTGLVNMTIGNSVTSIGSNAFEECTGLKEIHISDLSAWCNIDFYNLYANPLYHANNLYLNGELVTNLVIPDNITIIKSLVFAGCTGITSVTIGNGVISIEENAFYSCSGLKSITIPNSVTSIGDEAFYGCINITDIKSYVKKVFTANENIFSENVYTNTCLHVPEGRKFAYERATPWNLFHNIVEMDFTGIDDIKGEMRKEKGEVFDLNGRVVDNPTDGIYIINGKKVLIK